MHCDLIESLPQKEVLCCSCLHLKTSTHYKAQNKILFLD